MARVIKFRAWDKDRNKMITNFSKSTPRLFQNDEGEFFCGGYKRNIDWQELILMQFTGLLDKAGNEIYEGDIVSVEGYESGMRCDESYTIAWRDDLHSIVAVGVGEWLMLDDIVGCQIIGNIHQNPELLNSK